MSTEHPDLRTWLEERETIHGKGSSGRWDCDKRNWDDPYGMTLVYDVFHNGDTMDRDHVADAAYDNVEAIVDAHNTLPKLLAGVRAVLELADDLEGSAEVYNAVVAQERRQAASLIRKRLQEAINDD